MSAHRVSRQYVTRGNVLPAPSVQSDLVYWLNEKIIHAVLSYVAQVLHWRYIKGAYHHEELGAARPYGSEKATAPEQATCGVSDKAQRRALWEVATGQQTRIPFMTAFQNLINWHSFKNPGNALPIELRWKWGKAERVTISVITKRPAWFMLHVPIWLRVRWTSVVTTPLISPAN